MNVAELRTPGYLLWSVQRALLNEVTPDLRGVAVGLGGDRVWARFLFDGEVTAEIAERVIEIETEVIADYSGRTPVEFHAYYCPTNERRRLESGEYWAYLRKEG